MNEYAQVMNSITELRRTLENRLQDCITADKAEKLAEAAVEKLHGRPAAKALLPQTKEDVLARAAAFRHSAKNIPETPWTSAYGAKFGGMAREEYAQSYRGRLFEKFFGTVRTGQQAWDRDSQHSNSERAANNRATLLQMERDWEKSANTIAGGWREAMGACLWKDGI